MRIVKNIVSLINLGSSHADKSEQGRIRVENSFCLSSIIFAIPYEMYFITKGFWAIAFVFLFTQIILLWGLYSNYKGQLKRSKNIITAIYAAILPIYSYFIGFESGFYLYYFLAPVLFSSIFDFSDKKRLIATAITVLISALTTVILGWEFPNSYIALSHESLRILFRMNFLVGLIILCSMSYHIISHYLSINNQLKRSNTALEKSLKEKELLLSEIHHRVKNNLAILSGMMNLQINQVSNDTALKILKENRGRVHSMSLIHNNLYRQKQLNQIEFSKYLNELVPDIVLSHHNGKTTVETKIESEELTLPIDKAIPLGIMINEIIVNSLKYAFHEVKEGVIHIKFRIVAEGVELIISDNGKGFDTNLKGESLGLELIESLSDQIDANMTLSSSDNGTVYSFKIKQ